MRYLLTSILFFFYMYVSAQSNEQLFVEAQEKNDITTIINNGEELVRRKDYEKAIQLYKKAVEQGNSEAMLNLSDLYLYGIGGAECYEIGYKYAKKAYDSNVDHYRTAFVLGNYYAQGKGCKQDVGMAKKYFMEACAAGNYYGYYGMAYLYAKGQGVEPDKTEAIKYIDLAIKNENNHPYSAVRTSLGMLLWIKGHIYSLFDDKENAIDIWCTLLDNHMETVLEKVREKDSAVDATSYFSYICRNLYNISNSERSKTDNNTYVLVIGNEHYKNVANVPYANNDSFTFYLYCRFILGINDDNIHYSFDASLGQLRREINWLKLNTNEVGHTPKVIVYYAGHGIPDEQSQSAYLLPIDGVGTNVRSGYSLNKLYSELTSIPSEQIIVFLDACFSGTKRDGDMLASARGVAIKVKEEKPQGNIIVLSASQGDETAYPDTKEHHGLFTYYLLKKLQESKGEVTLGELSEYIITNVKRSSIVNNGKLQTPTVNAASGISNWRYMKLR